MIYIYLKIFLLVSWLVLVVLASPQFVGNRDTVMQNILDSVAIMLIPTSVILTLVVLFIDVMETL